MSAIPWLGGLTALTVATNLTLMAVTELQYQDRAAKSEAEFLAAQIAVRVEPFAAQQQLDHELENLVNQQGRASQGIVQFSIRSSDGLTVTVNECRRAVFWSLPWLANLAPKPVCAEASARRI